MSKPELLTMQTFSEAFIQLYERYLPSAFDPSLSMLEKVNKVILLLNEYGKITNEMLKKWNEVIEWILNEGLEQAVEDKLQEWLDNGTLGDIINEALFGEMNGKISALEAEMPKKMDASTYYDNLGKIETFYDAAALCFWQVIKIPYRDDKGNVIQLKQGIAKDSLNTNSLETPRDFALRTEATFVSNASTFSSTTKKPVGLVIQNGTVLQDGSRETYNWILGIKPDNTLKAFPASTQASTILNEGYTTALCGFVPIIQNGAIVDNSILTSRGEFTEFHARQWIGQDSAKNLYFFTSEGRRMHERGMTFADCARVTKAYNSDIQFAFQLDGGGSSQSVYYGSLITQTYDGSSYQDNTEEREVANFLYIAKPKSSGLSMNKVFQPVSEITRVIDKRLNRYDNGMAFIPSNRIELEPYLLNGAVIGGTTGSSKPWMYVTKNNLVYMMGTVKNLPSGLPFLKLPVGVKPVFSTHHIVPGDSKSEIFKIIVDSDQTLQAYYWAPESTDLQYVRLDGIQFPILPSYWDETVWT